jgi:predicted lactoylglutathione lyase
MATMIFVNLPVKDLEASKSFYTALGYSINPQFTDENAACVVVSDTIFVMLLTEPFFTNFTKKQIADARTSTEAIIALSAEDRAGVDRLADLALANGGSEANPPMEEGPMYSRSFQDPDGHLWEVMWMDPAAIEPQG